MHRQVPVIGILLIIQGALEILMGGLYAIMGPAMLAIMQSAPPPSSGAPPPEEMTYVMGGIYLLMGLVILAVGIIKLVAGIMNIKYKGRVLGFVALGTSIVSMFTCYCAPTAIGLGIYGLIVYLNQLSAQAFAMGAQGMTPDQIRAQLDAPMGYYPPGGPPGPPGYGGGYGGGGYGGYPPPGY